MKEEFRINSWQIWNQELKTALENSDALCVAIFTTEGELLFSNSGMEALFTDTPRESFIHPTFEMLVKVNTNNSLIFEGIITFGNRNSFHNKSIQTKVFKKENQLLVFGEFDIKELVSINSRLLDLTNEINDLQRKLMKAKKEAEAANRAKSEFLRNMSHEIRNPLNGVIGFTDIVLKTELNETQIQHLNIVSRSANSLLNLLNDLLDFSKIESGKLELNNERVDLFELLEQAIDIIKYNVQEKKLGFKSSLPPETPRFVFVDPIRLRQILINLLGNAVKFTHVGELEIKVEILSKNEISKEMQFLFSVRDTGIGISKANQKIIFEEFSQAESSITRKYGGTGLGLSIANKLLALMDSKLELESEYGTGSKFSFSLNLKVDDSAANQDFTKQEEKVNAGKSTFTQQVKILIVDDNEINILLADTILSKLLPHGNIFEAKNGKEAVEQFLKEKPDLVFMDLQMPVMNGYEATIEIRKNENGNRTPIIAVTAGIIKGEIERCMEAGIDDYVSKPILIDTFEKLLTKWLRLLPSKN